MIPPVQIWTALDDELGNRRLTVNRADPGDTNVVISFQDRQGRRDAIGIPSIAAIEFAEALLAAATEVDR